MRVLVLGPVGLGLAGRWVAAPSEVARAVLAALALADGAPVADESLYELVWGARRSRPGPDVVPVAVHRLRGWLRQQTGGAVSVSRVRGGYALAAGVQGTDVAVFRELVAQAGGAAGSRRLSLLERALTLWRGPALADVPPQCRDEAVVARLERERVQTVRDCAAAALAIGAPGRAVDLLEGVAAADPLDEATQAVLVEALAAAGRQAAALGIYEQVRDRLADELGVDPGPPLRAAYLRVLRQQVPSVAPRPPLTGLPAPCLLPPDIADFTGRQQELRQICELLAPATPALHPTLVISPIAGRAGVGKTALAVHAAHHLRDVFPDGQLFVNLGGAEAHPAAPVEVLGRFLRALGVDDLQVPEGLGERQEMYRNRLAGRCVLVVLDNAADEAQVEPLLPGSSSCVVIVTSRNRLTALAGARAVDLDVLEPDLAVQLLATIAGPERIATERQAAAELVRLCGRLPLAVRVAGARLAAKRHWALAQLVDRLAGEHHRLDELTHRHLEVRASLALSYRGVDPQARRLLRLLGVLEASDVAAWVAAPLLEVPVDQGEDAIERLVDAQLLDVAGRDTVGRVRYRMHDLIRLYARERAQHEEPEADRTAALERVFGAWLDLVQRTLDAAGWSSGIRGHALRCPLDPVLADRLLADPRGWFDSERLAIVAAVRQAAGGGLDEVCWELAVNANPLFSIGNRRDESQRLLERALAATRQAGNKRGQGFVLFELAAVSSWRHLQADAMLHEAIRLFKQVGDRYGEGYALVGLAHRDRSQGRYEAALRHYEHALGVLHEADGSVWQIDALRGIAMVHLDLGDTDRAQQYLEQALAAARSADHRTLYMISRYWLGRVRLEQGRLGEAEQAFTEALEYVRATGEFDGQAIVLYGFGLLRLRQGQLGPAGRLLNESLTTARDDNDPLFEALALGALGEVDRAQRNLDQAATHLDHAIAICREINARKPLADALVARGDIAHAAGLDQIATDAWAEALSIYAHIGSPRTEQLAARIHALHPAAGTPSSCTGTSAPAAERPTP
jgi:DNA-binding SARP family transcriptional activator/predicted negative regulator of RcsB-dependent stress response